MIKRKVTDTVIALAQKMRVKGMGYNAIASVAGVSVGTAYRMLNPVADERYRIKHLEWTRTRVKDDDFKRRHCAAFAKYYKAHSNDEAFKERARLRARKWYIEHKEQARCTNAEYRKKHSSEHLANNTMRKALILGATIGNLIEIKEIYRKAKEAPRIRCYICGELIPKGHRHVDHITPLSGGGAHRPSNLAVACDKCNTSKGGKMPIKVGILI